MKKRIGLIALFTAIFCLSGLSAAYFIYGRDMENSFSVGGCDIEIEEDFNPPRELTIGENVFKKRVSVKNTGNVPCFVRVFAEFSDSAIRDISQISPDGKVYFPAADYRYNLPGGWVYIDEDDELLRSYYYYTSVLEPGKVTPPLFDSVKTVIEDASQIKDYEIIVYAESVQAYDVDGNEYDADAFEDAWREFLSRR